MRRWLIFIHIHGLRPCLITLFPLSFVFPRPLHSLPLITVKCEAPRTTECTEREQQTPLSSSTLLLIALLLCTLLLLDLRRMQCSPPSFLSSSMYLFFYFFSCICRGSDSQLRPSPPLPHLFSPFLNIRLWTLYWYYLRLAWSPLWFTPVLHTRCSRVAYPKVCGLIPGQMSVFVVVTGVVP